MCVCVCMYIYICIYVCVYMCMYICMYMCVYKYVYIYVCVECCGTSFVHTSVVRRLRLSAVFGTKVWCAQVPRMVGVWLCVCM